MQTEFFPKIYYDSYVKNQSITGDQYKLMVQKQMSDLNSSRENLGDNLKEILGCKVLFGKLMVNDSTYLKLALDYNNSSKLAAKCYGSNVLITKGEYNFFEFYDNNFISKFLYASPYGYFNSKNYNSELLKKITTQLKVDLLVVNYSTSVKSPYSKRHRLISCLYFISKDGIYVEGLKRHSKYLKTYDSNLNELNVINKKLITDIPKYLKRKSNIFPKNSIR
jgi:hypothetical protein